MCIFLKGISSASLSKIRSTTFCPIVAEPLRSSWIKTISLMFAKSTSRRDAVGATTVSFRSVPDSVATISSYFGEFRKFSIATKVAFGAFCWARFFSSSWVTINVLAASVRLLMARLVTSWGNPAAVIFLRRIDAPIALEPIPASQAKMMCWMPDIFVRLVCPAEPFALNFAAWVALTLSSKLSAASLESAFKMTVATAKDAAAPATTPKMTGK